MGQTELGQVWLGSSYTYVRHKSYGFSLAEVGQGMESIMFFNVKGQCGKC